MVNWAENIGRMEGDKNWIYIIEGNILGERHFWELDVILVCDVRQSVGCTAVANKTNDLVAFYRKQTVTVRLGLLTGSMKSGKYRWCSTIAVDPGYQGSVDTRL